MRIAITRSAPKALGYGPNLPVVSRALDVKGVWYADTISDPRTDLQPLKVFVERSRCAGRTIKGVRERPEFQTPGYDKYPFQSNSLTPKVH